MQDLFHPHNSLVVSNRHIAKPFIKWVGGKRGIIKKLLQYMPSKFNNYHEPFLGGGALFYEIQKNTDKCYLSDINKELIITYEVVKNNVGKLIELLKKHKEQHTKEYFLEIRKKQNLTDDIEIAGRFIYLNKTCFNGLYRVNSKGDFNTPIGSYKSPNILDRENLLACNQKLKKASIVYQDFKEIKPKKDDFVYFDPPYHPINNTSFKTYTQEGFIEKHQKNLRDFSLKLAKQGIKVMLSNSDTEYIRELYKDKFNIRSVEAPRNVNCKGDKRQATNELLITSY